MENSVQQPISYEMNLSKKFKHKFKILILRVLYKLGFKNTFYFDKAYPDFDKLGYENCCKLFEIETGFHDRIVREDSAEKRYQLYCEINKAIKDFKSKVMPSNLTYGFVQEYILEHQFLFQDKTVIDFGCGYGLSTELLSKFAQKAYGLDCVEYCLNSAKERFQGVKNIEFRLVNNLTLPFEDQSIEAAYSNDFIEHIHEADALFHLQEMYRVLKPGGNYLIWTPGKTTGPHDITMAFWPKGYGFQAKGAHIKEYSFTELSNLFYQAGFTKVTIPNPYKEVLLIAER